MNIEILIKKLIGHKHEEEWFEFKSNYLDVNTLGEYISALANSATLCQRRYGYLIFGIDNETHKITGTTFDQYKDYKGEPMMNYLSRNLSPETHFRFEECKIDGKRLVATIVEEATWVPIAFKNERYIRVSSSKNRLSKHPDLERELFEALLSNQRSIEEMESPSKNLAFSMLLNYYQMRGVKLNTNTFKENLHFFNSKGEYNYLAYLLSDAPNISIRINVFAGLTKSSELLSIREFGKKCLLYSMDDILAFEKMVNINQVNEEGRSLERMEVPLFDSRCFREAVVNAIVHNKWIDEIEPVISVFNDRIEIVSRGGLPRSQTRESFFSGKSVPVNRTLADIFLQLRISEKTGRGVPTIVEQYGRNIYKISTNFITVTIPFHRINVDNTLKTKVPLNIYRGEKMPLENQIIEAIRQNPYITITELAESTQKSTPTISNYLKKLRESRRIERYGARKNGFWKIIE